jgi:single-strand DNA-binding protein
MIISGVARIGNDPSVRHTPAGDPVLELSLAFNYGQKGPDGKKPTQWLNASLWGARAEKMAQYLTKGTQVSVTCSDPHINEYKTKDGQSGSNLRARIEVLEFVYAPKQVDSTPKVAAKSTGFEGLDDDIPFN